MKAFFYRLSQSLGVQTAPLQRLWIRWWQKRSQKQQDKLVYIAPILSVAAFMAVVLLAFAYLQKEDRDRQLEGLERDKEYITQRVSLRLRDQLGKLAGLDLIAKDSGLTSNTLGLEARAFLSDNPEVATLTWLDAKQTLLQHFENAVVSDKPRATLATRTQHKEFSETFLAASKVAYPVYSHPILREQGRATIELFYPLIDGGLFKGALVAQYDLAHLLNYAIPNEINAKYAISAYATDSPSEADFIAGKQRPSKPSWLSYIFSGLENPGLEFNIPILGNKLLIKAQAYKTSGDFLGRGLFWLAAILSALTAGMLAISWRYARRRFAIQRALIAETNFRRTLENSLPVGIRVIGMDKRIRFVNPALCEMTGYSESELLDRQPPYPFWPQKDIALLHKRLERELLNPSIKEGHQVQFQHKDGRYFYARVFTSPLLDDGGKQTGWVSSIADITEATLTRQRLFESYERFTTVLESLDASVSLTALGGTELLFCNRLYRQWFGEDAGAHLRLVREAGMPNNQESLKMEDVDCMAGLSITGLLEQEDYQLGEHAELFIPEIEKWLEVRARYINWVDGRLGQMVICTDITARRLSEAKEAEQAARTEKISRLITMGEMASGVAHELNQPLAAISNYSNGLLARLRNQSLKEGDLEHALEKTSQQAYRAGQIIQRIRNFVKRSEPKRSPTTLSQIVHNALELAEIDIRKRGLQLRTELKEPQTTLWVDPILIEQVLINLLKNAADATAQVGGGSLDATIELSVYPHTLEGHRVVQFSVRDSGPGIDEANIERLYETFYSTKADGMGMGLSLCRSIVESHQGRIHAQNIYNNIDGKRVVVGAEFSFYLPLETSSQHEPTSNSSAQTDNKEASV